MVTDKTMEQAEMREKIYKKTLWPPIIYVMCVCVCVCVGGGGGVFTCLKVMKV